MSEETQSEVLLTGTEDSGTGAVQDIVQDQGNVTTDSPASVESDTQSESDPKKEVEDKKETPKAPEKYTDFSIPEGMSLDAPLIEEFSAVAKEHNLSQDAAQKFIDIAMKSQTHSLDHFKQQIATITDQWAVESRSDKEFGGEKFNENLGFAKKALDKWATPEFKSLLVDTKLGNHKEMIRLLMRAGKEISEDGFIPGSNRPRSSNPLAKIYDKSPTQ